MKTFDYREIEFVMGAIEDNFEVLALGGFSKPQIDRLKQCFSGKRRQFEALKAALWTHYCHREKLLLDSMSPEKRGKLNHFGDGQPPITNEAWINNNLAHHAHEIQNQIFSSLSSKNMAFFEDYAYFLENPIRNYSRLKLWLIEVCWGGDGDGNEPYGTETAPLTTAEFKKFSDGEQRKVFSGEELAELYQNTRGESIEVSLIYRTCRELGIKTKHPKRSRQWKR